MWSVHTCAHTSSCADTHMYPCIPAHVACTHLHTPVQTCTCEPMNTKPVYTRACAHICVHLHSHTHAHLHTQTCASMPTYTDTCIHTCVHVHTPAHTRILAHHLHSYLHTLAHTNLCTHAAWDPRPSSAPGIAWWPFAPFVWQLWCAWQPRSVPFRGDLSIARGWRQALPLRGLLSDREGHAASQGQATPGGCPEPPTASGGKCS